MSQQGRHTTISKEDEIVQQKNLVGSLQTQLIQQVHNLKLRVLFGQLKVQSVLFKCKAKMVGHHDEKSFINEVPQIEMKNTIGSTKNL